MVSPKHIVITVFGSLGDLHPMMALALGLQARGHRVTIAASPLYEEKITSEGIGFAGLRPDKSTFNDKVYDEIFDMQRGPETLLKKYLLPSFRDTCEDLCPLLEQADFLINSPIVYPGPVLAEHLKKPWASVGLQPFLYFSADDPPTLPQLPAPERWLGLGRGFWRFLINVIKSTSASWSTEVYKLRKELGVPDRGNPIFEGQFSPYLNLAMFSPVVGPPQRDWPPHTQATGFVFYDRMKPGEHDLPGDVRRFLDAGEPPVIFTLGSSVVKTSTSFYETSLKAVESLDYRAIFLAGENRPGASNDRILWQDAVAYSALFPHAAAVVHQGGMGTTAQVLRAGKPMIIVPHGFDQPDNASRLKRLGASKTLYPKAYTAQSVARELQIILKQPQYAEAAQRLGKAIRAEDGLKAACDAIEAVLEARPI